MSSEDIQKSVLPNGLTVLTQAMPERRSVSLGLWVRTGSRDESIPGTAHFIEHMMFKGTETRDAKAIAASLESLGGHLDAFTTREQVVYTARVLSEHLPQAVEILSDLSGRSRFDAPEIERERRVVKEEILSYEDNPEERVGDQLSEQLWGDHPLGKPILGTSESVDGLTREGLLREFAGRYRGDQLVFAAAGGLDHAELVELSGRWFTPPQGEAPESSGLPAGVIPTVRHTLDDVQQMHLSLGTRAICYTDPRRPALIVLETLLGGGMSSRLFQSIREDAGLAYSVFSSLDTMRDVGMLTIHMGVSPDQAREALRLLRVELMRLVEDGPDVDEVTSAQMQLKGSVTIAQESVSSRMYHMARQELYTGRYRPPEEQVARILAVTRDEVAQLAREFLRPERYTLAAIGPDAGKPLQPEDWPTDAD